MNAPARLLASAFSVLVLASCYQVPVTGRNAINLVDDKELTKMSITMFDDQKRRTKISRDPERLAQLQRVGERISKVVFWDMPDADWEFVVFDSPEVNAFAMAGGKVGVYTGLYKVAKTDDEVAAVIAHEIAHVTAKHVHERLSRDLAVRTVGAVGMIGGAVAGAPGLTIDMLGAAYGLSTELGGFAYDRRAEKEADYIGLMYMARAGYDPRAAIQVMEALDAQSSNEPMPPAFLSTHPTGPERIIQLMDAMPKALEEMEKSTYRTGPKIVK
ncbi:MAG: M48 family metallopeptidase [Opitutaceae bacterium]|nr:M48 family metallopeptidase [Opitutaceae bacterium]